MKQWICSQLPEGCVFLNLPAMAAKRWRMRMQVVEEILGPNEAQSAVEKAGPYYLADDICRNLRLRGLELPEHGEISSLSPHRWQNTTADLSPEVEICGVSLSGKQEKDLAAFLRGRQQPQSVSQFLEIAQHFFYEESLKVAVRYTAPRFKPS